MKRVRFAQFSLRKVVSGRFCLHIFVVFVEDRNELHFFRNRPVFTARRKRGLCCRPVSVSPSVCHVGGLCEDIVKLLSQTGSPIILVFDPERRYPIPRGTHSVGAQNTRAWNFFLRFSTEIAVYLGNGTR